MEETKKIYVATNTEKHCGEDAEFFIIGTFDTLEKAQEAIRHQFEMDKECQGIEDDEEGWTKNQLDDYGSFSFSLDKDEYNNYGIEVHVLNK